ncbi:sulfite exporter TauE/SafE family protein [uncultured Alsobacter sp.]|uniref:sulfite exporter TauE/SafE family protein n=1 Tax=uncultured Alsobacter sp. TaxID=1748258 RepID=UPI0025DD48DF|nr:sulfite exporter TauE/SafE family protein [uncultured Alsobacter sp.]
MQIYLPIAELPVSIFLVLGLGAAVGFISGMFGVGGGFLMTPLLIFIGIPPAIAVATESAQIAASSMTGAIAYWRRRALDVKLGTVLLVGGIAGTVLGVWFFNAMRRLGQLELVIVISYVVLLGAVGGLMLVESLRALISARRGTPPPRRVGGAHPWYFGLPLRMRFHRSKLYLSVIPLAVLATTIGFAGAVLGIGGGFLMVPALIYLFRVPTAVVVGTSLFQILFTMVAATILHAVTNQAVDIVLALLLVVGGVCGAQFGARAGKNVKGEHFRLMLALIVLAVGIRFASDIALPPEERFSLGVMEVR